MDLQSNLPAKHLPSLKWASDLFPQAPPPSDCLLPTSESSAPSSTDDEVMEDRHPTHPHRLPHPHRSARITKRLALAAMIAVTSSVTFSVQPVSASENGVSESEAIIVESQEAVSSSSLQAVPASEQVSLRSLLQSRVVTAGVPPMQRGESKTALVAGTTIADLIKSEPQYAKRTWSDEVAKKETVNTPQPFLKPFIAPESLADMVRMGSPRDSTVPGTVPSTVSENRFESGLSLPSDFHPTLDATADSATTMNQHHVGHPISSDAVNIQTPGFQSSDFNSVSKSQVAALPAESTDLLDIDPIPKDQGDRARRVANHQGFDLFSLKSLTPPALGESPEGSLIETELPSVTATVHANRLRELAQISLRDSRSRLQRRATHSAQKYAFEALRLAIDVEDAMEGGNAHMRDLRVARNAIRESKDFGSLTSSVDWRTIQRMVASHETSVLKDHDLTELSSMEATEAYLELAREKLVAAGGRSSLAAEALILLGKIEQQLTSRAEVHSGAVSLTYQGAATLVSPRSAGAHREFGHTLLQQGLVKQSIRSLKQSVAIAPTRAAYQSLLEASRRDGDYDLARHCLAAIDDPRLLHRNAVKPLAPRQFAATYRPAPQAINHTESPSPSPAAKAAPEQAEEKTRIGFRSFFSFGRR